MNLFNLFGTALSKLVFVDFYSSFKVFSSELDISISGSACNCNNSSKSNNNTFDVDAELMLDLPYALMHKSSAELRIV